jgi:hypothetical protein
MCSRLTDTHTPAARRNRATTFNPKRPGYRDCMERAATNTTCVACDRCSDDPDREGWHFFSDGADEHYALCSACARSRTTARVAQALFSK